MSDTPSDLDVALADYECALISFVFAAINCPNKTPKHAKRVLDDARKNLSNMILCHNHPHYELRTQGLS